MITKFGIFFFYEGIYVRSYFLRQDYDNQLEAEIALAQFLEKEQAQRWHSYLIKPIDNENNHEPS